MTGGPTCREAPTGTVNRLRGAAQDALAAAVVGFDPYVVGSNTSPGSDALRWRWI